MRDATDRIELLGDTLIPILKTPGVPELLTTKASHGCDIRILVSQPGRHLAPLLDHIGIEIRVLEAPAHNTIHRFDEQLMLTLHLRQNVDEAPPILHLQRAAPGGLFDRLADHYEYLWEDESQPIEPDLDIHDEDQGDHDDESDPERSAPDLPDLAIRQADGVNDTTAPPPRRWPRRPT
jgi:hypothetical protein